MALDETTPILPRASLLTYFRRPRPATSLCDRAVSQSCNRGLKVNVRGPPTLPRIAEEDEEEEGTGCTGECFERCVDWKWAMWNTISFFCYVTLIFVTVVNLDMIMSKWGLGVPSRQQRAATAGTSTKESFHSRINICLMNSTNEDPSQTSRTWSLIKDTDPCDTEALDLRVSDLVYSILTIGDRIITSDKEEHAEGTAAPIKTSLLDSPKIEGDDTAKEGQSSIGIKKGGFLHSGFGGQ